jgi:hypothetical protein
MIDKANDHNSHSNRWDSRMSHSKVDQQLGGCHQTVVSLMNQEQFDLHPSLHPNIHRYLEQCLGMKFVFLLLLGGEYQHRVMLSLLVTNQHR